jgi:hypothetical protein
VGLKVGRLVGDKVGRDVGGGVNLALGEEEGRRLKLGEALGDNDARILGVKEGETLLTTVGEVEGPTLILGLVLGVTLPEGAIEIVVPSSLAKIRSSMDVFVIVTLLSMTIVVLSSKANILVVSITGNGVSGGIIFAVALKSPKSTNSNAIDALLSLPPSTRSWAKAPDPSNPTDSKIA